MYRFSRSIYRELANEIVEDRHGGCGNHERVLRACEDAIRRLATDRHYFARPARSLFREVRSSFPMTSQMRVYRAIESHLTLAHEFVEQAELAGRTLDGAPLSCHASTRRGSACRRFPLPGNKYCPSHRHLEERAGASAA